VYPHQTERLTEALTRGRLGALVATSPDNVAYVTGRSGFTEDRHDTGTFAVFTPKATALVVPAFAVPAVVAEAVDVDHVVCHGELVAAFPERQSAEVRRIQEIVSATASSPADALVAALALTGIHGESVGLDESRLGPAAWQNLVGRLSGLEAVPAAEHLMEARRVKSPYEIECLDRALRIAEEALDVVIQALERGMTERDAAMLYAGEIVKRGATPLRVVVAMGDRTWIPTPRATERALRSGDLVRFDVSAMHRGYCGGVARTAVFGVPAPQAERAYLALQAGLEAASDAIRPGASADQIVETAARVIMAEGLPRRACRLLGHGIGLASLERPELASGGEALIEAGEVLCVEAPYYDIGSMGLAVRDTLLVTSAGARAMNRSRHDLVVLD
jgi:Xaa-Pro dipeptidase